MRSSRTQIRFPSVELYSFLRASATENPSPTRAGGLEGPGDGGKLTRFPGWVRGHAALFDQLRSELSWIGDANIRFDRWVEIRRLVAERGAQPHCPVLARLLEALGAQCGAQFRLAGCALYRDGQDFAPFTRTDLFARHRQKKIGARQGLDRHQDTALVFLGGPREVLLRRDQTQADQKLILGLGDLLLLGQEETPRVEYSMPKMRRAAPSMVITLHGTRVAHTSETDPPR